MKYQNLNKIIGKYDWKLYITRQMDLLTLTANARSSSDELIKKLGFGIKIALHLGQKGMIEWYRDQDQQQKFIYNIQRLVVEKPGKVLEIFKEAKKINQLMLNQIKKAKQFEKSLQNKTTKELGVVFKEIYNLFLSYFAPCVVIPYFIGVAEEQYGIKDKNKKVYLVKKESKKLRAVSYYINYRDIIIKNLFLAIAKKKNINAEVLDVLTPEEIFQVCNQQFKPSNYLLKKRKDFLYIREKNKETLIFDAGFMRKAQVLVKEEIPKHKSEVIRGQIGFKGVVKGVVKIIRGNKDFPKFKKGNILVTINSNPSLMPVIEKCRAIISDEGGITCHAAIISRELHIPCIIGTKIATKVLKDGDLVEVDANQGVVKILKRSR